MPAVKRNIIIEQYSTFVLNMVYRDAKRRPVNLAGWGARMRITGPNGTVHANLSETNGITLNATPGAIRVVISDEDTALMNFGDEETAKRVRYDLKLIPPNGMDFRLMEGRVIFSPGVTP